MNKGVWPVYSHGGTDAPNWPAIVGDSSHLGAGRPVSVIGAINHLSLRPAINMVAAGTSGTCTVRIQCNGGALTNGVPDPNAWIDALETDLVFDAGQTLGKKIQLSQPYWRTYVVACSGNIIFSSYVPCIHLWTPGGGIQWASANYPSSDSVGTVNQ